MDSPFARSLSSLRWALLATLLAGCSAIRFEPDTPAIPDPEPPRVEGSWNGAWIVEGQQVQGTLVIRQQGNELAATFSSAALGKPALGSGRVEDDGRVRLELEYDLSCPGKARMTGTLGEGGAVLGGALAATDCTGDAAGTFSFARR